MGFCERCQKIQDVSGDRQAMCGDHVTALSKIADAEYKRAEELEARAAERHKEDSLKNSLTAGILIGGMIGAMFPLPWVLVGCILGALAGYLLDRHWSK